MKAIVIDPFSKTIVETDYNEFPGESERTLKDLMGGDFDYGGKHASGDTLIMMGDWYDNIKYDAFMLYSSGEAYFGKVALISFSFETGGFRDCKATVAQMEEDVKFCLTTELRNYTKIRK